MTMRQAVATENVPSTTIIRIPYFYSLCMSVFPRLIRCICTTTRSASSCPAAAYLLVVEGVGGVFVVC
jgi:hypothetical protein